MALVPRQKGQLSANGEIAECSARAVVEALGICLVEHRSFSSNFANTASQIQTGVRSGGCAPERINVQRQSGAMT